MPKSVNLIVRLDPGELERLRDAAARAGYPGDGLSEWVRRTLYHAAGLDPESARRPRGNPELLAKGRRRGNGRT